LGSFGFKDSLEKRLGKKRGVVTNSNLRMESMKLKKKRETIPVQAWTGLEGRRRLRLPDLITFGKLMW
jgi:hypothetical protein